MAKKTRLFGVKVSYYVLLLLGYQSVLLGFSCFFDIFFESFGLLMRLQVPYPNLVLTEKGREMFLNIIMDMHEIGYDCTANLNHQRPGPRRQRQRNHLRRDPGS